MSRCFVNESEKCACLHPRKGHANLRPGKGPEPCLNCRCPGFRPKGSPREIPADQRFVPGSAYDPLDDMGDEE